MPTLETFEYPGDTTKPLQTCFSELRRRWIRQTGAQWSPQQFRSHSHRKDSWNQNDGKGTTVGEGSVTKWDWRHLRQLSDRSKKKSQWQKPTRNFTVRSRTKPLNIQSANLFHHSAQISTKSIPTTSTQSQFTPSPLSMSVTSSPSDPHYTNSELSKPHVWTGQRCEVL